MSNEHYDVGEISVIEVIRAKLTPEQLKGFCLGQVIKYSLRANHKGDFEGDTRKLADYAKWLHELSCDAGTSKPVGTDPATTDLGSQWEKLCTPDPIHPAAPNPNPVGTDTGHDEAVRAAARKLRQARRDIAENLG